MVRPSRTLDNVVGIKCDSVDRGFMGEGWCEILVEIRGNSYLTQRGQLIDRHDGTYIKTLVVPEKRVLDNGDVVVCVYAGEASSMERSNIVIHPGEEDCFLYSNANE